jgi:hypothetical protein
MVWSVPLTASRRGGEGRLEAVAVAVVLGDDRIDGFPAQTTNVRESEEAPVQGREDGTREGRRGHLGTSESSGRGRRRADLRRGIPQSSLRLERRSERGEGEDVERVL